MPSQMPYMRWQHNKRAASGLPAMANMNNTAMMNILKCKSDTLRDLKVAFRQQMEECMVNGQPFLGQLPSEVDVDGKIREALWAKVAASNKKLRDILDGKRYGADKPNNFEASLLAVKNKICSDHTNEKRKKRSVGAYTPDREVSGGIAGDKGSDDEGAVAHDPTRVLTGSRDRERVDNNDGKVPQELNKPEPRTQVHHSTVVKRPAPSSWRTYPVKRQRPATSVMSSAVNKPSPLRRVDDGSMDEEYDVNIPPQATVGSFHAPAAVMQGVNLRASEENAIPTTERESLGPRPFRMTTDSGIESGKDGYVDHPHAAGTAVQAFSTSASPAVGHDSEADDEIKVEQRMSELPTLRTENYNGEGVFQASSLAFQQAERMASSSSESGILQHGRGEASFFGKRSAMGNNVPFSTVGAHDTARKEMPPPRSTTRRNTMVRAESDGDDGDADNEDTHAIRDQTSRSSTGLFVSEIDHSKEAALKAKKKSDAVRNTTSRPSGLGLRPLIEVEGMKTTVSGLSATPTESPVMYNLVPKMNAPSAVREESGAPSVKTPPPPREISESIGSTIDVAPAPPPRESAAAPPSAASESSPNSSPEPRQYPARGRRLISSRSKAANTTLLSPTPTASDSTVAPTRPAKSQLGSSGQRAKDKKKDEQIGNAMKQMLSYQVSNMAEKLSNDFLRRSNELEARLVAYVDQRLEEVAKQIGKAEDEELKERIRAEILQEIREGMMGE